MLALKRAWQSAAADSATIGLLEAHGTGTPQGDRVELTTIGQFFGDSLPLRPVLGSVKSMIGHAMPAAGAASLIKTALAMHHRFLPPTLNCEEPHPLLAETGFRILGESEPWETNQRPLRAAVNAFGFGGINAHAVLEAVDSPAPARISPVPTAPFPDVRLIAGDDALSLTRALTAGHGGVPNGHQRLALENPTPERVELALKIVKRGKAWRGRNGVWYSPDGAITRGGRIAFLYPGVDGQFDPRIDDIADHFNCELPPFHDARDNLVGVSTGIIAVGRWLTHLLQDIGVKPDAVGGHSIGEWTAMIAAGISAGEESDRFIEQMVPSLEVELPGVAFAAAGCGVEMARDAIAGLERIAVSHDNCPHQIILCGADASIGEAVQRLRARGVLTEVLPFRSGFHSPLFEDYVAPLWSNFEHVELRAPALPIWSATTVSPYPQDPVKIAQLFIDHLIRPVRFRELTERLYADGFRFFVQLGMGRLVGFIDDTLKTRDHAAVAAVAAVDLGVPGMQQLRRLASGLWCEGYDLSLEKLGLRCDPGLRPGAQSTGGIRLPLAAPLVTLTRQPDSEGMLPNLPLPASQVDASALASDPVLREFAQVQSDIVAVSAEVMDVWQRHAQARKSPTVLRRRHLIRTRRYGLDEMPELIDHCFVPVPEGWPVLQDRFP
ncbi:MAG: acyltransferase domain-containing protein, partial [Thiohalocapsa sp.]